MLEGASDEELARLDVQIDAKLYEAFTHRQSSMTSQQREQVEWTDTYTAIHDDFPFLKPDHPQASAELNEDINTYFEGRLKKGESRTVALQKAVDKFAPAYAKSIGGETENVNRSETKDTTAADKLKERLNKQGFSELRSAGSRGGGKPFTGINPMTAILGKT